MDCGALGALHWLQQAMWALGTGGADGAADDPPIPPASHHLRLTYAALPLPAAAAAPPLGLSSLFLQIEALTASKAELKTQVRTLLTSQTDLLTRVATLTTKWQQAVAENAALHRQNLQLAARQCL